MKKNLYLAFEIAKLEMSYFHLKEVNSEQINSDGFQSKIYLY